MGSVSSQQDCLVDCNRPPNWGHLPPTPPRTSRPGASRPPMLAPPGPLGRHLGALWPQLATKMSQHIAKMLQKMQSWSQLRLTQCPRCLRHAFQDPPKCKKPIKTYGFSLFFAIQLMWQNRPRMLPEAPQNLAS